MAAASSTQSVLAEVAWTETEGFVGGQLHPGPGVEAVELPMMPTIAIGKAVEADMSQGIESKSLEVAGGEAKPKARGAPPPIDQFMNIREAFGCFGLAPFLVQPFLEAFQVEAPDETDAEDFAYMPEEESNENLKMMQMEKNGVVEPLAGHHKGNVKKCLAKLYKHYTTATTVTEHTDMPPSVAQVVLPPPPEKQTFKFSDHLAQGQEGMFRTLTSKQVEALFKRFQEATGDEPEDNEAPSAMQLSALAGWMAPTEASPLGGHPFVDFGIFGPFGARVAKKRAMSIRYMNKDGTFHERAYRGPITYEAWRKHWNVFQTTAAMLGIASRSSLTKYAEGIKYFAERFPDCWGDVVDLDEAMREEQWLKVANEIASGKYDPSRCPEAQFDCKRPWDFIIKATRFGCALGPRSEWWTRQKEDLEDRLKMVARRQNDKGKGKGSGKPWYPSGKGDQQQDQAAKKVKVEAAPSSGACWNCGQMGHSWKDCPTPWKAELLAKSRGKGKGHGKDGKNKNKGKGGKGRGKGAGKPSR